MATSKSTKLAAALEKISWLYVNGRLTDAKKKLSKLQPIFPDSHQLWSFNGVICAQVGSFAEAKKSFQEAIRLSPKTPDNYTNLGNVCVELGDFSNAIMNFDKSLELGRDINAVRGLSLALTAANQIARAIERLKELGDYFSTSSTDLAEIVKLLGNIYLSSGDEDSAVKTYQKWLRIQKNNIDLLFNYAEFLQLAGRHDHAQAQYQSIIAISPNHVSSKINLASMQVLLGHASEAKVVLQEVLRENPKNIKALLAFADLKSHEKNFSEVAHTLQELLNVEPNNYQAHLKLGLCFQQSGDKKNAELYFKKAIAIDGKKFTAKMMLADLYQYESYLQKAIQTYLSCTTGTGIHERAWVQAMFLSARLCEWKSYEKQKSSLLDLGTKEIAVSPFALIPFCDNALAQRKRAENWYKTEFGHIVPKISNNIATHSKKIRIGYFSADFNIHPVMYLISRVLQLQDREKFEVHGFSFGQNSNTTPWPNVQSLFDFFHEVDHLTDYDIAKKSNDLCIDIGINLGGYTRGGRSGVFAYRAAPVQVNFLGYPGTLGASVFDFIIADKFLIPDGHEAHYTEAIVRMPDCYMPTDDTRQISLKEPSRHANDLPKDAFVFCCFNNTYKISPDIFEIWMRLLLSVPNSVLWLRTGDKIVQKNLQKMAEKSGVEKSRVIFASRVEISEHLARYKLADLVLDTFLFNGHTTTSEALWAGTPVLTLAGNSFASRVAGSLLSSMAMQELIANSTEEYEKMALEIATDKEKAQELKTKIQSQDRRKKLFDSEGYTRCLERAFKLMLKIKNSDRAQRIIDVGDLNAPKG